VSVVAGPILAVDASTLRASAALLGPGDADWGRWLQAEGERGSASLAPAVAELLAARALGPEQLEGFVVGTGPGSYTGLRSGIAFVRALAFALKLPLAGVSSFALAAQAALSAHPEAREVSVWLDARRGEAYRADYARAAAQIASSAPATSFSLVEVAAPRLVSSAEAAQLESSPDGARLVVREPLPEAYHGGVLGRRLLSDGGQDPAGVLPLYLKRSHAEIALEERSRRS